MVGPMNGWRFAIACLLIAGLLIASGVTTGARSAMADTATPTRITFLNPGKRDEFFWPAVSAAMQAAADQFGYQLDIVYAERDAQAIGELGHEIIARPTPPDLLILVNEFQAGAPLLRAADAKGIKTFMLLNSFYGSEAASMGAPGEHYQHWIGSLVPDNKAAGRRMGNALATCVRELGDDAINGDGKYHLLALLGDSTTPASIDRTAGLADAVAANADLVLDRQINTNWQTPKGHDLTGNFLDWAAANMIQPAGIWAANDALALGAIEAAGARQLQPGKDLCVVGLNWSPEALDLVRNGKMAMTDGGHFLAGGWAMVMIHDYLTSQLKSGGGTPARALTFQMAPIDRGNVVQFFAKLGDRDWRRIDFKNFSQRKAARIPDGLLAADGGYDFSLRETLDLVRPLPVAGSTNE